MTTPFENLELTCVMARVRAEFSMDTETAERAEKLYRQFLQLHKKHPETELIPSRLVDAVWHQHILDSEKYMNDCHALFGSYLHHRPGLDTAAVLRWEQTKKLYAQEFNVDIEARGMDMGLCGCHKCTL